jgi:hypothetical protein
LEALACAVCCALPVLITAGVFTDAGTAVLEQTLLLTRMSVVQRNSRTLLRPIRSWKDQ